MSDQVWPGRPTGPNEHEQRHEVEQHDVASHQTELDEQKRIGDAQRSPFAHNRLPLERKPR